MDDKTERRLGNVRRELEEGQQNLEEEFEEMSEVISSVDTPHEEESEQKGFLSRLRDRLPNIRGKENQETDEDRRKYMEAAAGGLGVLGLGVAGAGAYNALTEDEYDLTISENGAVEDLADEYRFSSEEALSSIGSDLEDVIQGNSDRDYQIGFRDTVRDNQIHLKADNILQESYTDIDPLAYSQARSKAENIKSQYEGE